ncbi:hypothetical protein AC1031_011454 [Aphanomyces cochlioides]|nr:hypothetical protein AC1031_011454 [Aphanomyces cochlioides]
MRNEETKMKKEEDNLKKPRKKKNRAAATELQPSILNNSSVEHHYDARSHQDRQVEQGVQRGLYPPQPSQVSIAEELRSIVKAVQQLKMHDEKKSKEAEKKRSKDILICNTSYDPPPPIPQICLAISDPSVLPPEFALLEGERLAFWKKADINDEE